MSEQTRAQGPTKESGTGTGTWEHGRTEVDGVDLHWVHAGRAGGTPVVLLHGWPQTWYAWRKVIPVLAQQYEVYAIDLPGLGDSGSSSLGHGVRIAADLLDGWRAALDLPRVHVVGHDLGGPIGYAWAASRPGHVGSFALIGVPLHGFGLKELIARAGLWHFGFFSVPGLAEGLSQGREQVLLEYFYRHALDAGAVRPDDIAEYLRSYAQPERLANGFAYYRGLDADTAEITALARTKLPMPALAVGCGQAGGPAPLDSLAEVASDVRGEVVAESGHYVAEEQPDRLSALLLDFFERASVRTS
ncbi:alpha/beta hydrolase [Streptomyces sp. NBC_00885]|uniref:alpha/beta fold hydrolase n=1 Tax=Streptomyces sp. NBC_00885 TaxID=2975857 RepID=UPI003868602C|nr:alpha/beta hydrolase [Streptomyces sp. NBC_00885]